MTSSLPDQTPGAAIGCPGSDALFRPVRLGNAFEETVERLLQIIKLGVVPVGERLPPERELSQRLQVSRVTLREAIRTLQQSGHVVVRRGRYGGTFVAGPVPSPRPSPRRLRRLVSQLSDGLDDAFTYRQVVETGAAEHAAIRELSTECETLLAALHDCETAPLRKYRRCDSRLHLAIAEATGSPTLVTAVFEARTRINELLDAIPLIERNLQHSNDQHRRIIDAIIHDDPPTARQAMTEHLEGTAALLRGFLS